MKKAIFGLLLVSMILLPLLSGCNSPEETTGNVDLETIIDGAGREILLAQPPERIVSLMPSITEKLFALGLGDKIVGVTDLCDYPAELKDMAIPSIGDAFNLSVEVIASLEPDLVLATWLPEGLYEQLSDLGFPVAVFSPASIDETMESILLLGKLTGRQEAAEEVVSVMQSDLDAVSAEVAQLDGERVKVLFLLDEFLYVTGPGTLQDELITRAGGVNVVEEPGWPQLSIETILTLNPDVIVFSFPGGSELFKKPEWQVLDCVREGRTYKLDENLVSRPGV